MPYSLLEAKPIEELCKVVDCEHKTAPYVDESEYLVVRTSNVRDGQLVMESMKYTTLEGYNEWTSRAVPEHGDVLFTREAPAGESCLVPSDTKVCMGQRMVMLRPHKSEVDPVFLSMILNTERTKNDIYRLSIGSTVSRINIADIKKLKVASPPLPEQQKIAKILSTWDKAISTTECLIDNSTQQKKALMQQLLTGKKRLLDDDGKPFEGEWEEVTLQSVLDLMRSGLSRKLENENVGIAVIRSNNMGSKYTNNVDLKYWYLDDPQGANVSNYILDDGDLLVNFINSLSQIGKACIYRKNLDVDAIYTTNILRIKPNTDKVDPIYLYLLTQTANYDSYITSITKPAVNQASFTTKEFGNLKFNLPPLKEQQKIATVLTNADREIELLEQQLADLQQEKKALMQVLLTGKKRVRLND